MGAKEKVVVDAADRKRCQDFFVVKAQSGANIQSSFGVQESIKSEVVIRIGAIDVGNQDPVLEMEIKYEGYLKRELDTIEYRKKFLSLSIPEDFNYSKVKGLKTEAVVKLEKHRPMNLEMAGHISGVDPSDVDLLLYHLVDKR